MSSTKFCGENSAQALINQIKARYDGRLPYSNTVPNAPEDGDVFIYTGTTTSSYEKGGVYQYNAGTQLYGWVYDNTYDVYTLSATPSANDHVYDYSGDDTGYVITSYDSANNAIEVEGISYLRDSFYDKVVGAKWVAISKYKIGDGLEVNAATNTLSAKIATTHSLGITKGGSGTMIGDHGEVNVYQRLKEDVVSGPWSRVTVPYYDSGFRINTDDNGEYIKGGIYELQITEMTPVGTENPSEEGWYEYTGTYGDDTEYELTEDTTVDSEKTYYTIAWKLVSANSQEFNTDDFEIENNVVSLDVTQRTFTGSAAEWDLVEDKSIYTIVNLTDDEPTKIIPLYADMAIGTIVPFGGSTSVDGFLLCDGSEYNRTDYPELFEVIGTSFGTPSANTKFKVPDLREATTKGAGLTGLSNNHYDADGLALGEFIEDRVQEHVHEIMFVASQGGSGQTIGVVSNTGSRDATISQSGRSGATTEVKAVGVNYIIKARQVALPIDLERQVVEANEYSTTETIVGKWIDGKPIYRKVFYNDNWTDDFSYDANALNIDEVTSLKAMWIRAGNCFEAPYAGAGGFYSTLYYNTSSKKINFEANVSHAGATNRTIIEYTKED